MSAKKEQKSDSLKKTDKMVDNHREFLDMDTDEEDFGRQESPEVEEELPLEPEKPVYSEEDLITLVSRSLITLIGRNIVNIVGLLTMSFSTTYTNTYKTRYQNMYQDNILQNIVL